MERGTRRFPKIISLSLSLSLSISLSLSHTHTYAHHAKLNSALSSSSSPQNDERVGRRQTEIAPREVGTFRSFSRTTASLRRSLTPPAGAVTATAAIGPTTRTRALLRGGTVSNSPPPPPRPPRPRRPSSRHYTLLFSPLTAANFASRIN